MGSFWGCAGRELEGGDVAVGLGAGDPVDVETGDLGATGSGDVSSRSTGDVGVNAVRFG